MNEPAIPCIYCGGATRVWGGAGSAYRECNACGLVALAKIPNEEELNRIYADHYSRQNIAQQTTARWNLPTRPFRNTPIFWCVTY